MYSYKGLQMQRQAITNNKSERRLVVIGMEYSPLAKEWLFSFHSVRVT